LDRKSLKTLTRTPETAEVGLAGCWTRPDASVASAAEARLKRGRVCTLLGRTSRLFPNRELCAARQRMPDEG